MTSAAGGTPLIDREESDCEDQGYSLVSEGCPRCGRWEGDKRIRTQFAKVPWGRSFQWQCPGCKGYYGEAT